MRSVLQSCWTVCDPIDWSPPVSLSMGFFRQGYRSGLPFPPPGDLPDPGIEFVSLALAGGFFTTEPPGKPIYIYTYTNTYICSCITFLYSDSKERRHRKGRSYS